MSKYGGRLILPGGMSKSDMPSSERIARMSDGPKEVLVPGTYKCTRCGKQFEAGRVELACPDCFAQLEQEAQAANDVSSGNLPPNVTRATNGAPAVMGRTVRPKLPGEGNRILVVK